MVRVQEAPFGMYGTPFDVYGAPPLNAMVPPAHETDQETSLA